MRLLGLLQYSAAVIATLVLAPAVIVLSVLCRRRAAYAPVRIWARILQFVAGIRFRVHGLERVPQDGSYVIIANHCSHLDGPTILLALPHPVCFVIKRELAAVPLWGTAVVRLGFISVDRSDSESARLTLRRAVDAIREEDRRVLVFAEGTRSPDGRLQRFKKGGFHLAIDAQVPILPVTVNGSRRLFPKGAPAARPGTLDVWIDRPIETSGLDHGDVDDLVQRTYQAILATRRLDPDFPD